MSTRFLGQYLLDKGRISSQQLLDGRECQKQISAPVAAAALEKGLVSLEQIKMVLLQQQKKKNMSLGELAREMGFLSQAQCDELLKNPENNHRWKLAETLLAKGHVSPKCWRKNSRSIKRNQTGWRRKSR